MVLVKENGMQADEIVSKQMTKKMIFSGDVSFDLGPVSHPSFGSVHIKGKFPRLKPKYERSTVSSECIEFLKINLLKWVEIHFGISEKEKYFNELARASVLFTVYVNPFSSLDSAEMDLVIKIYFWLWFQDDELENAIENSIPFQLMRKGTDQISKVLKTNQPGNLSFEDVDGWPFFKPLFNSLVDLHKRCLSSGLVPDYEKRVGPMQFYLQRYFEAMRWYAVDQIDGRYSEESFRCWRRIIAYFDGIAEVVTLVQGVTLPQEISKNPILSRILDIANSFGGFVNDLLGMKKEFEKGQKDNLVVFKVLSKKQSLEKVVEEICALMETELADFIYLKKVILREFENEENLVKYLHILESLIDGHNLIYLESTRHKAAGCVKLTRRSNNLEIFC